MRARRITQGGRPRGRLHRLEDSIDDDVSFVLYIYSSYIEARPAHPKQPFPNSSYRGSSGDTLSHGARRRNDHGSRRVPRGGTALARPRAPHLVSLRRTRLTCRRCVHSCISPTSRCTCVLWRMPCGGEMGGYMPHMRSARALLPTASLAATQLSSG